jgi:hypothetical protein
VEALTITHINISHQPSAMSNHGCHYERNARDAKWQRIMNSRALKTQTKYKRKRRNEEQKQKPVQNVPRQLYHWYFGTNKLPPVSALEREPSMGKQGNVVRNGFLALELSLRPRFDVQFAVICLRFKHQCRNYLSAEPMYQRAWIRGSCCCCIVIVEVDLNSLSLVSSDPTAVTTFREKTA